MPLERLNLCLDDLAHIFEETKMLPSETFPDQSCLVLQQVVKIR